MTICVSRPQADSFTGHAKNVTFFQLTDIPRVLLDLQGIFFSLRYIGQNDLSPFNNSYYTTLFKYTHNFITIYSVLTLNYSVK